jgi:CHAT domain-containing protein
VGLTQSFLIAGANALTVSLWSVADTSTAEFMISLYQLSKQKNASFDLTMANVKRKFIEGEFGNEFSAPYFWAPFVYYGK